MLLLVLCCCAFTNDDEKDRIIISVNTPSGIGYFTDGNGNFLFNKQFEYVCKFSEGLASVRSDGWYGVINAKGEAVVPCIYYDVGSFRDGLAYASIGDGRKQIIDRSGHIIIGECETAYWTRIDL